MRILLLVLSLLIESMISRADLYVTLKNVEMDRCASAWLIARFVDPEAKFQFIEFGEDPPSNAVTFDFFGAQFFHEGTGCTYTALVKAHNLQADKALVRIEGYVNDVYSWRWAPQSFPRLLRHCMDELRSIGIDDSQMLEIMSIVLDEIYQTLGAEREHLATESSIKQSGFDAVIEFIETNHKTKLQQIEGLRSSLLELFSTMEELGEN